MSSQHFDIAVIGAGPSGQKAAIQGAKARKNVILIEQERTVGGSCVHQGTIPSKTLRETTIALTGFRFRAASIFPVEIPKHVQLAGLLRRLDHVIREYSLIVYRQLKRNGVEAYHGRARFVSPREIEITHIQSAPSRITADVIVIATGSRPRNPKNIPVDHENILDSDSILSIMYLPESLAILGSGVIASEYASIFAGLGVKVTMIDKRPRPVGFLDDELTDGFLRTFESMGGRYIGNAQVQSVEWDGVTSVMTKLDTGETVMTSKMLLALGREANLAHLDIGTAGLKPNEHGLIDVDEFCRTSVPHIYAVGDVGGFPALASSAMEQGRRAILHALGLNVGGPPEWIPSGIYTIPEMSMVGLTEIQARQQYGNVIIGRAKFAETARGLIANAEEGLLKMIADPSGRKLLGVHIVGEGATELIHLGQVALAHDDPVDMFVESIFNFPTFAEAYRVAALDIANQRAPVR